jgi:hypothetical protein
MGWQRVSLSDGELNEWPACYPLAADPGTDLTPEQVSRFTYRGMAWVEGEHIGIEVTPLRVYHLTRQPMTPGQSEYVRGWNKAMAQKVRRAPRASEYSDSRFFHGWQDAWKQRKETTR